MTFSRMSSSAISVGDRHDEGLGQHGAGSIFGDATAHGEEQSLFVEGANGVAVGALHVVGVDFEFRLGADMGAVIEDERLMAHARIGAVGAALDQDPALEDGRGRVADEALDQLRRHAVDFDRA